MIQKPFGSLGVTGLLGVGVLVACVAGISLPVMAVAASPGTFFVCELPKTDPVCTATSEADKSQGKTPCTSWKEISITTGWLAENVLPAGSSANGVLARSATALYGFS